MSLMLLQVGFLTFKTHLSLDCADCYLDLWNSYSPKCSKLLFFITVYPFMRVILKFKRRQRT